MNDEPRNTALTDQIFVRLDFSPSADWIEQVPRKIDR